LRRAVGTPIAIGLAAAAVFLAGGALVRLVPDLRTLVVHVLDHVQEGNAWLVLALALANGAAEEVFFRGAVFAALAHRRVLWSTGVYALVTVATWNPMLVLAGVVMGLLFGLQRRASGGILAPLLTHLTWSVALLVALPAVVGA
jgi:membrane protease YdiL (CAAX protease family)